MQTAEDAATGKEGGKIAGRKCRRGQQHGGTLQRAALAVYHGRMNQGGDCKPRDQRAVLHGVPIPIATPAEFLISPISAHENADSKHDPTEKRPRPGVADPGGVHPTAQQRRGSQGERNRAGGVAEEHHRRVQQHRRVLQRRAQPSAIKGDREAGLHRVVAKIIIATKKH